jgi:YtcA family
MTPGRRIGPFPPALVGSAALSGCDPAVNLWGSVLPAWVVCLSLGAVLAGLLRWLFARTGLERHLGPLALVYPCLVVLLTCLAWIVLFRG